MANTYDSRTQEGASRRRREDALALYNARRWNGAIYLGGYAIECSLKALICYIGGTRNFKDTPMYTSGARGASLHNLESLLKSAGLDVDSMIISYPSGELSEAWRTVVRQWDKDGLRYGDKVGNEKECERFIEAVKLLHDFILGRLKKQGRMHND